MTRTLVAVLFATLTLASPVAMADTSMFPTKPDILETIQVKGEIDQDMWQKVSAQVKAINTNPRVRAVLIVVDSPGGVSRRPRKSAKSSTASRFRRSRSVTRCVRQAACIS